MAGGSTAGGGLAHERLPDESLPLWRTIVFGGAGLPIGALAAALLIYLPPHLATQLGVPLVVVGGVWASVRLIDIGFDPILGMLMDRTRTPIGRYRPWMLAGAPLLMLGIALLFFAPVGIGKFYLIGGLLVLYAALSILGLSHPAWAATLARSYHDRSRIFGVMAAVGIVALLAVLSIPVIVAKRGDSGAVHAMGWFLLILTPIAIGLAAWLTPERQTPRGHGHSFALGDVWTVLKTPNLLRLYAAQLAMGLGPGWMSSLYLFFAKDYMGFTSAQASVLLLFYVLAGLAGAPTTAWLANRIGKHRAIMAVAVAYSVGLLTVLLPPKGVLLNSIPVNLWCGFAGAGFEMTIRSMLADVADEVRLKDGRDRLSLIYALNTAAAKLAAALAIIITFPMLGRLGFVPALGLGNSPEAIRGLGIMFVAGPIGCVILGAVCMVGWKLTAERHAEIRAALEARDAEAALGAMDGEHVADAAAAEGLVA
ncbi:MFS transporter [Phenylobacterium soli]|uniref:MFS transporter n=1 Tax=Phenylobacterium soli TaxID=2170551 RepID=A0A328ANX0_9CAUL|nr:MFS transporter [Phenylobacterium soli]RAK54548.1 MFS transporter [Phenylobacterium soli]